MATAKKENTPLLQMGKYKKDDIDDLRYGEGKIFKKIANAVERLKDSGEVDEEAQPVIIIVEQKKESGF